MADDKDVILNLSGTEYKLPVAGEPNIPNIIDIDKIVQETGLKTLYCKFQDGPTKEAGYNGVQFTILIEIALSVLKMLNANVSCRENLITVTKLEEALMWQQKRTENRIKAGTEGFNK